METTPPAELVLPEFLSDEALRIALAAGGLDRRVPLRLRIDARVVRRIEPLAGALLGNLLLGHWSGVHVDLQIGANSGERGINRSGLAFAIARRRADRTSIDHRLLTEAFWRTDWAPRRSHGVDELFPPEDRDGVDPVGSGGDALRPWYTRAFAAYVNPHLNGAAELTTERAKPWLRRTIPRFAQLDRAAYVMLNDVGDVLDELLLNVAEHGAATSQGIRTPSLLQLSVTRGGSDSYDRLYVLVADWGRGIPATLCPKLDPAAAHVHCVEDAETLLTALLERRLGSWQNRRGTGLADVAAIGGRHGGSLDIVTTGGPGAVHVRSSAERLRTNADEMPVQGTIVVAMLPLRTPNPSRPTRTNRPQQGVLA